MQKRKLFFTFEGGEGSGKTSIITRLVPMLKELGYDVLTTREPGGVKIAEEIRDVILNPENTAMSSYTEALLYAASRMQHLHEKVVPALENNKIVICDRYLDSSLAYQGYARNVGLDNVLKANFFALDYLPEITFFIDVTPEVGLARLKGRDSKIDRLDMEKIDFHQRVYQGYLELCKLYPDRIRRIEGNRDIDSIVNEIFEIIKNELGK